MDMSGDGSSRGFVVAETRRRWSVEEKRAIVAAASGSCTNVSAVARRHGISPSLLFRWMKDFSAAAPTAAVTPPTFLPVTVSTKPAEPVPAAEPAERRPCQSGASDNIEIELANGLRLRVGADIATAALKRIIGALEA